MKIRSRVSFYLLGLVVGCLAGAAATAYWIYQTSPNAKPVPNQQRPSELAPYMDRLQRYSQKLGLALKKKNKPLAQYYRLKMKEASDQISSSVPEFQGQPVGDQIQAVLVPELRGLKSSLQKESWGEIQEQYERVIQSCNNCHAGTGRGMIRMDSEAGTSPYNQIFGPGEDTR